MQKGEIWVVNMGSTDGHEQEGIRPAVIIADVVGSIVTIVPCTSNLESLRFPFTLAIESSTTNKLDKISVAVVFQLRAIDKIKLKNKIGILSKKDIKSIDILMKKMLGL